MPTVITQTQLGYDEEGSDNDASTKGIMTCASNNGITENLDVKIASTLSKVRQFVQVTLEGKRVHSVAKVRVRCHLRERKTGLKASMSKAKVSKAKVSKAKERKVEKKAPKAKTLMVKGAASAATITDPNYTATLKLLKQIQFDDLMAWRRIAFQK